MIQLIPAQESAFRVLKYVANAGSLMLLSSPSGRGRTTVLRKLHTEMAGGFVTGKDFIETSAARHPLSQHLPPALVRSGRVELWLEMKLPDSDARKRILENHLRGITAELSNCDLVRVISVTEGFTGADIKRLVEDAKGTLCLWPSLGS